MKNVLVLCGGKSAEHEVSIRSAQNIVSAMDRLAYQPIVVVISRSGAWYFIPEHALYELTSYEEGACKKAICSLRRLPEETVLNINAQDQISIDLAFPLIHGPLGEDGTLQGLLEMMSIPYVGSGVLASAIGMDKSTLKSLLSLYNLPIVPFVTITSEYIPSYSELIKKLNSSILFIKPSLMGSSVGISKVKNESQYHEAIENALRYDHKIIAEQAIVGQEMECSVLGNDHPVASVVGQIKSHHEFYSYEAKYIDPQGADLIIPAPIEADVAKEIKRLAIASFKAIGCKGYARVDFFVSENQQIYINELNTIPGFTSISMYPKLWEASNLSYTELVSQLIQLGLEWYTAKKALALKPEILMLKQSQA